MFFCVMGGANAQSSPVHHNIQDNATTAVERIAKFSVSDAPNDLLEIVNGTQNSGQFVPNLWAHRSSDNRIAFSIFTSVKSNVDNGSEPVMTFRAEQRDSIYDSYPYPWGSQGASIQNRPLFSWSNYTSTKMLMKPNGYLGIGTTSPTARLHTVGSVRFQSIGSGSSNYVLVVDSNGNVGKKYMSSGPGGPPYYLLKNSSSKNINNINDIGIGT